jgi:hypothetical protein
MMFSWWLPIVHEIGMDYCWRRFVGVDKPSFGVWVGFLAYILNHRKKLDFYARKTSKFPLHKFAFSA